MVGTDYCCLLWPPRPMESDSSREDISRPEMMETEERPSGEADPRGFHELAFLGESNAAEAEPELEERDIGPEFDSYEDLAGDKLRLLDRWACVCACSFVFPRSVAPGIRWERCRRRFLRPSFSPLLHLERVVKVSRMGKRGLDGVRCDILFSSFRDLPPSTEHQLRPRRALPREAVPAPLPRRSWVGLLTSPSAEPCLASSVALLYVSVRPPRVPSVVLCSTISLLAALARC